VAKTFDLENSTQAFQRNQRQRPRLPDGGVRNENVEIPLVELGQSSGFVMSSLTTVSFGAALASSAPAFVQTAAITL
jgi:hypothetical protein